MTRLLPVFAATLCVSLSARAHDAATCQTNASPSVVATRAALAKAPASLETRFALADALVEATCYDAAVHTLEDGEKFHPRNAELQTKLRTTRSLVSEETYFAGMEQAEVAARVSRNLLRCSRLGELNACDEALKLKPDDVEILIAKGDAQLAAGKPGDAETTYRRARQNAPDNAKITAQLAAAQAQRQDALGICQKDSGDAALAACQKALLRGADDEFTVHTRLAQLFRQSNQPAAALNSYIAANGLKRDDRNVALGIVAVTDADAHRDAVTSAARGSALLTLGRAREALTELRQAQSLSPEMPDLRPQIAQAEKLARSSAQGSAMAPVQTTSAVQVADNAAAPKAPARRYSNEAEPTRSY